MRKNERFGLRLPGELVQRIKVAADERGITVATLVRNALEAELRHGETAMEKTERMMGASFDRLSRDVRALHTNQQAVFALTDSLARLFLTCVPEPPPEVLDQAKRKARLRYSRFLKSVAQNMTGDSRASISELTDHE